MKSRLPGGWLLVALCIGSPFLLSFSTPPSSSLFPQTLAYAGWGGILLLLAAHAALPSLSEKLHGGGGGSFDSRALLIIALPLSLLLAFALGNSALGSRPWPLGLSSIGALGASLLLGAAGLWVGLKLKGLHTPQLLSLAWMAVGVCTAIVCVFQFAGPGWTDGTWISHSVAGRAIGLLRQPNHTATLLLWAAVSLAGGWELQQAAQREPGAPPEEGRHRAHLWTYGLAMGLLILAVVLTASRTGTVGVVLLGLWGALDRQLSTASRRLLMTAPLIYSLQWVLVHWVAPLIGLGFDTRLITQTENVTSFRLELWSHALQLALANPWTGVGWGDFNFAWTLTPFAERGMGYPNHAHNALFNLAAEIGIPAALVVVLLPVAGVVMAWRRARNLSAEQSAAVRWAAMMSIMVGLHSALEFPLWYAYFLLPASFHLGLCLGMSQPAPQSAPGVVGVGDRGARGYRLWLATGGAACVIGAILALHDHHRLTPIFTYAPDDPPLEQRIAEGKKSLLFPHYAYEAVVITIGQQIRGQQDFDIAARNLISMSMLRAWSRTYAQTGDLERARYLAQRLKEFVQSTAPDNVPAPVSAFLGECDSPSSIRPYQCDPPSTALSWRSFLPARR